MRHTGAAERLDQRLFNDAVFDIERQLAGALLRSAPAHAVRKTADILDFFCRNPLALFGDGSRSVVGTLGNTAHFVDFCGIDHTN